MKKRTNGRVVACPTCGTYHVQGRCVTAQPCDPVEPAPYVVPADRFPTRAPPGPFRK